VRVTAIVLGERLAALYQLATDLRQTQRATGTRQVTLLGIWIRLVTRFCSLNRANADALRNGNPFAGRLPWPATANWRWRREQKVTDPWRRRGCAAAH